MMLLARQRLRVFEGGTLICLLEGVMHHIRILCFTFEAFSSK